MVDCTKLTCFLYQSLISGLKIRTLVRAERSLTAHVSFTAVDVTSDESRFATI